MAHGGKRSGAGRPPGAVNKVTNEVRALAGQHSEDAIKALVDIMHNAQSDAARVSAAQAILDRAHGKPAQAIVGSDDDPAVRLHNLIEFVIVEPKN